MQPAVNNRFHVFDGIKVLMILVVFIYHMHIIDLGICALAVNFFFVLSGMFFYLCYNDKKITVKNFYLNKFVRFYPFYFFTFILAFPGVFYFYPDLLSSLYGTTHVPAPVIFMANLFFIKSIIPIKKIYMSYNYASWFISTLFLIYLLTPLLLKLQNRLKAKAIIFFVALYMINIALLNCITNDHFYIYYICPTSRSFDFFIGMFLAYLYKIDAFFIKNKKVASLSEGVAIIILLSFVGCRNFVNFYYCISFYYLLPLSCLLYSVFQSLRLDAGILPKLLKGAYWTKLSELVFPFYLIHEIVMSLGS